MNKRNQIKSVSGAWRHYVVVAAGLLLFGGLIFRLAHLHWIETDFLQGEGAKRSLREQNIVAYRGMITDRNGEPLAVSTPVHSVWMNPKQVLLEQPNLKPLAQQLGISVATLNKKVKRNAGREFVYLARHLNPVEANKIAKLNIAGVALEQEYKRYYPAAEVTAHLVGFTNIDEKGIEGVELAYDDWLDGEMGKSRVIKDRLGRLVKDLGVVSPATAGNELQLSIDLRLQYQAYRELKAAVKQHGAKSGSLVMVDVDSGEILAMVNQPSFNPNNRNELRSSSVRNRAVTDIIEPGSTVKPFTVVAALLTDQVNKFSVIDTSPGYMRVGRKTIRDHRNYGVLDITGILTKSSNIGVSKLALEMGGDTLWSIYQQLGLGRPVGIGLPGEQGGKVAVTGNRWSDLETATLSYGYGLAVTPIQLAQAYQTLAHQGVKMPLSLVPQDNVQGQRVIPTEIAKDVVDMLETVIGPKGTARRGKVEGYRVAGKTGTAHKVGVSGYQDDRYRSVFAGVAPVDNPKIVTVVVIDEPSGQEYYGGEVAAPVFSRVMQSSLRLLNVPPTQIDGYTIAGRP